MSNLKKNIAFNFTYQLLIIIVPFITAPYLARTIGASGVGTYSFSQSMALNFTYFALLGLSNYGNRSIASVQDDKRARSKIFFEIYSMQLITFGISLVAYLLYIRFFSIDKTASVIMLLWYVSSAFDINWFFFGMEQFKLTVTRNMILKLLSVVCIFSFVKSRHDVYIYIAIMASTTLLSQLCLWPYLSKFIFFVKPSGRNILAHFKPNLVLFIPVIAISFYKIMDKVMLGYMSTMAEVGYYENAEKIINIAVSLISAIGTVMLPRMTALVVNHKKTESRRYLDDTMLVTLAYVNAVMFGLFAIAKEFCMIYFGSGFSTTGRILEFMAVVVVFLGCENVIITQYLIPNRRDRIYIVSAVIGALFNFGINLYTIPRFASIGTAIGTICAEFAVCAYQLFMVRKNVNIIKYMIYEIMFMLTGIIMFGLIRLVPPISNIGLSLVIHILLGAFVYLAISLTIIKKVLKRRFIVKSPGSNTHLQ